MMVALFEGGRNGAWSRFGLHHLSTVSMDAKIATLKALDLGYLYLAVPGDQGSNPTVALFCGDGGPPRGFESWSGPVPVRALGLVPAHPGWAQSDLEGPGRPPLSLFRALLERCGAIWRVPGGLF